MARLEGAFQQVNERLGAIEGGLASIRVEISALRTERKTDLEGVRSELSALRGGHKTDLERVRSELSTLRAEMRTDIAAARSETSDLRRQTATQFYWLLTFVLGSILVPLLRDLTH